MAPEHCGTGEYQNGRVSRFSFTPGLVLRFPQPVTLGIQPARPDNMGNNQCRRFTPGETEQSVALGPRGRGKTVSPSSSLASYPAVFLKQVIEPQPPPSVPGMATRHRGA